MPDKVIRLIGDDTNPAIVVDFEHILSCHVVNFNLNFQNENKGETIFTINLNRNIIGYNESQFSQWYNDSVHKKIYRIILDCVAAKNNVHQPKLFLSGWNYRNKVDKEGKYPVFSEFEPKVYFKEDTAKQISGELVSEGYSIKII